MDVAQGLLAQNEIEVRIQIVTEPVSFTLHY